MYFIIKLTLPDHTTSIHFCAPDLKRIFQQKKRINLPESQYCCNHIGRCDQNNEFHWQRVGFISLDGSVYCAFHLTQLSMKLLHFVFMLGTANLFHKAEILVLFMM